MSLYEIKLVEVQPVLAMTRRITTNMNNISEDMGKLYSDIWECIGKNGAECGGYVFALYYGDEFDPNNIDLECGMSVNKPLPESNGMKTREVEGGPMACTVHMGPYGGLESAYNAVMDWAKENGYALLSPMRDVYFNDPYSVPPEEVKTEVCWPVKKI